MIDYLKNLFRSIFVQEPDAVNASGELLPVNYERIILEKAVKAFNTKKKADFSVHGVHGVHA